jgi:excinuclease UvrABC helicase subunit UvrB
MSGPGDRESLPDVARSPVFHRPLLAAGGAIAGLGHHVVFGVAGSGKTVLLLARARLIAGRDPAKKVLVLSYNKALADLLAAQLDKPGLRGVEVRHFHSWSARNT